MPPKLYDNENTNFAKKSHHNRQSTHYLHENPNNNTNVRYDKKLYNRNYNEDMQEKSKMTNMQVSFGQYMPEKVDPNDLDRNPTKNKISYDFMTGKNYEKEKQLNELAANRNKSIGMLGIFDEMRVNKNEQNKQKQIETELQRFERD